ncbi:trypsin-like serine peptidase [Candidatus Chloroploca asiatica]|uniref:trypsin-like serine peptidase n=1 Tax=Candidatus Chloroploca asiatica TaxID=1506545 RepID=UPI001FEBC637|nr:serine protease [Candidatus Chloroploca asiatica]
MITPSYFTDSRCRQELTLFLERECQLGRNDLILPLLYLPTPRRQPPHTDPLAAAIATRTAEDWTALRHAAMNSPDVHNAIERLATHILAALNRVQSATSERFTGTPPASGETLSESTVVESGRLNAPMLPVVEAQRLLTCADAVALVSIGQFERGQLKPKRSTGTAWLITPDLALTCWHVVHGRGMFEDKARTKDVDTQVEHCLLTFNFTEVGAGTDYILERIECAERNSSGLDYALVRLRDRPDHPLAQRQPLIIEPEAPLTAISELYIMQHPRGQPSQGADGHFVRRLANDQRLHYTNPTTEGTSGSAVLVRPRWRVVAMHHGATPDTTYGEGIALRSIMQNIQHQRRDLYEEIMEVQRTPYRSLIFWALNEIASPLGTEKRLRFADHSPLEATRFREV